MIEEEWRTSPVRGDRYEVSSLGRVRSVWSDGRVKLVKLCKKRDGYLVITMNLDGKNKTLLVHRLIADAFELGEGPVVRHLDDNPENNAVGNLLRGTQSDNILDAVRNGRHPMAAKTECRRGHPFDEANTYITPSGYRQCRACSAISDAKRWPVRSQARTRKKLATA